MPTTKKRPTTSETTAMLEERISQIQTDIDGLEQNLINNLMLLRDIRWKENKRILKNAYDNLSARTQKKVSKRLHRT